MSKIVETKELCKYYKDFKAVDDISLNIEKGDIYGFVGENGAGKTTMIRMLTGLIRATKGEVILFEGESGKKMSAVVEAPALALNMNAWGNLKMQAEILGIKDEAEIDAVMEETGISDLKRNWKKVKNFSLGMRQRLGIAIALLGNPELMILDEPLNGLDPAGIVEVRELILKLNRERGITFIISSHILGELEKIATKYGFLSHGRLIKEITAKELEGEFKSCLEISTASAQKVADAISGRYSDYECKVLDENSLRIYGKFDIVDIVTFIGQNGFKIDRINTNNENVEDYYLNLYKGGAENA